MLIPHVVQTEADKVFVNILNTQAASVTDGEAVVWDASSPDGVRTTQAVTATLGLFVGLVDGTIAASAYGLAQAYGYKASAVVTSDTVTAAMVAGSCLIPLEETDALQVSVTGAASYVAQGTNGVGFCYLAEALTDTGDVQTGKKVFVRAL